MLKALFFLTLVNNPTTACADSAIANTLASSSWNIIQYKESWFDDSLGHFKFVRAAKTAGGRFEITASGKKGAWSIQRDKQKRYFLKLDYEQQEGAPLHYRILCPMDQRKVKFRCVTGYASAQVSIELLPAK